MKLLTEIQDKDVVPNHQSSKVEFTKKRSAARAVILDKDGKTALIFDKKYNHYKIPGGGVDENEDVFQALEREVMEEAGCKIKVVDEIGKIIEYREQLKKEMTSYCYLAELVGEKGHPQFTEREKEHGFSIEWIDLDKAIVMSENTKANAYNGYFMRQRDLIFLKTAKQIFDARKK